VRAALLLVGLAACGFDHGRDLSAGDGGNGDGGGSGSDGTVCAWSYTPTNFDPCMLPAPAALTVATSTTIDTATTMLPKKLITQSDATTITVIHLSQLTVDPLATLTVTGTGIVFAVDGPVDINGTLVAVGGNDNTVHCEDSRGTPGSDSNDTGGGGGGGGGAAAANDGGDGGDGSGTQAGGKGSKGSKVSSTQSPLRGGCRGGNGGRFNSLGQASAGGRGGGALQISTNDKITIRGMLDAAGRGGGGGPSAHIGGGGGGSGGAIFLEGPTIELGLASRLCADGGSGGEGGGVTVAGNSGVTGECTGIAGAQTEETFNSAGGPGGGGGYLVSSSGGNAGGATSSGGGGGGGGGVGWVRVKSPNVDNNGAVITPASTD
jgi:hypothetical protein